MSFFVCLKSCFLFLLCSQIKILLIFGFGGWWWCWREVFYIFDVPRVEGINNFRWNLTGGGGWGGGQENTVLKGASKRYRPLNLFFLGLWGIANWREKIIELNKNIGTADWLSGFGYAAAINSNPLFTNAPPAGIYFFIGNRNNRAMCEICSKLTIKCRHWRGLSLLLNLNIFHILFWCCNCWLWKVNAGRVDYACLE